MTPSPQIHHSKNTDAYPQDKHIIPTETEPQTEFDLRGKISVIYSQKVRSQEVPSTETIKWQTFHSIH